VAALPYEDGPSAGFVFQVLGDLEQPAPAAIVHLRGGHVLAGDRCACGLTPAQITAYGYPTCPASDIVDSTAVELDP